MNSVVKRGAFIVFEGCDRCGKSTQSKLLVNYLERAGIPVKHMVFPERLSEIGKVINDYLTNRQELSDETIHLLFTANRWEHKNEILKLLKSGTTLVVDRYSYSGIVYSVAKGMQLKWCMSPESGLPRPDAVFYLKAEVDDLLDRGNFGKERYEKKEFQKKVAQLFDTIYEKEQNYWHLIDAKQSREDVHLQIKQKLPEIIMNAQNSVVKTLNW